MVRQVIFGVEYLILATKTKMLGTQLFLGCMCGRLGALMGPPKDKNGRYVNPRQVLDRLKQRNGQWGHFGGGVPDISHKNKDTRETVVFWVYMWPFWGSDGATNGREWQICQSQIGLRQAEVKKMVSGVILWVEYLILATKTKMLGNQLFLGCVCSHFRALMGPSMVRNGRYANLRQV